MTSKKYYYVYRITCFHPQACAKYYYGCRSSTLPPNQDTKYWSSSKYVHEALKTFGKEWFKRKIISRHATWAEALAKEIYLHEFFDVKTHPLFFNKANQTILSFTTSQSLTPEQKEKIRQKALGRRHSLEARQKMSAAHKGKRKPLTQEHRQKIREALLGKPGTRGKRKRSPRVSKLKTSETKQKISTKMREIWQERQKEEQIFVCPHCGKEGKAPGIFIWHFDHCKKRSNAEFTN